MRRPCGDCPWRLDAPRGHWHKSHFKSIWSGCQDDGVSIMLCHKSAPLPKEEAKVCQGWVRVIGVDAIGVRIALINGLLTQAELNDKKGPRLFKSFATMLRANGIEPPRHNAVIQPRRLR